MSKSLLSLFKKERREWFACESLFHSQKTSHLLEIPQSEFLTLIHIQYCTGGGMRSGSRAQYTLTQYTLTQPEEVLQYSQSKNKEFYLRFGFWGQLRVHGSKREHLNVSLITTNMPSTFFNGGISLWKYIKFGENLTDVYIHQNSPSWDTGHSL